MKRIFSVLGLLFIFQVSFAQEPQKGESPDEQIKVNREYDENGNLIRFDSTMDPIDLDAIHKHMQQLFGSGVFNQFSDSTDKNQGNIPDFQNDFGKLHDEFFSSPFFGDDSTGFNGMSTPGNLDSLQQKLMEKFDFFFKNDTSLQHYRKDLSPGIHDFFFDPKEFEELRKKLEKNFDQPLPKSNKNEKMGTI